MATIYQANPGQLIAQPDRTVETFATGLLRVDQSFIGLTANEYSNRSELLLGNEMPGESEPAQDGLYIFPPPREQRAGDGFTKYIVSAYGRWSNTAHNLKLNPKEVKISTSTKYRCTINFVEGTIVLKSDEVLNYDSLNLPSEILEPYGFYDTTGASTILSSTFIEEVTQTFNNYKVESSFITTPGGIIIEQLPALSEPVSKEYTRTWRKYEIDFTIDGTTTSGQSTILISKPVLEIVNQRNFGKFVEYDFKSVVNTGINSTTLS